MTSPAPVPSPHDFADSDYVRDWVRYNENQYQQRGQFFDAFEEQLNLVGSNLKVLELGSGAGALAERLLARCSISNYCLIDISPPMHALARQRLKSYAQRTTFEVADFRTPEWTSVVSTEFDVSVTMQAVHELRHRDRTPRLYQEIASLLRPEGTILVCDHLRNPDDARPLYMSVDEHLAALRSAGLVDAALVLDHQQMVLVRARRGE